MAGKAKARTLIVRLISTAQTGFFYTTQRPRMGPKLAAVKYDPQGSCVCAIPFPSRPTYHLPFVPFTFSPSFPRPFLWGVEASEGKEEGGGGVTSRYRRHHLYKFRRLRTCAQIPLFIHSFSAVKRRVLFVEGKKTKK